jgi:hypothetical protein
VNNQDLSVAKGQTFRTFAPAVAVRISDLQLGDVVTVFEGPYGTGTVKQIKDGVVTILRVYVAAGDFSYTGGVICNIGYEECQRFTDSTTTVLLHRRDVLK